MSGTSVGTMQAPVLALNNLQQPEAMEFPIRPLGRVQVKREILEQSGSQPSCSISALASSR